MLNSIRWRHAAIVFILTLLVGCSSAMRGDELLDNRLTTLDKPASTGSQKQAKLDKFLAADPQNSQKSAFSGIVQEGNDRLTGDPIASLPPSFDQDAADVTLNLVNASIPQAAKSVLGDTLGLNYSIDPRIQGAVTLQTSNPITKSKLLELFEAALRDNGAVIVADGGAYQVIPLAEAARNTAAIDTANSSLERPGVSPQLVSLRFVSAQEMSDVLEPMIPQGMLIKADTTRNSLILSGTLREVAAIRQTISVFDVDWMRGMSFALVPVKSTSPAAIVQDLEQIYETKRGPLKGILRFVPNNRLKSVLVISSRAKYLKEATRWIRKIDVLAETSEASLHVYHVQNRNASDLAKVLEQVLGNEQTDATAPQASVAPKLTEGTIEAPGANGLNGAIGGPETPAAGIDILPPDANTAALSDSFGKGHIRVVADDTNNALLIYCPEADYQRMANVLQEIDTVPNQVLLEAVIAEVSLDDDLKFGVRWFLGGENNGGTFTDAANGAVSSVFPGFSYFLKANDIAFSLNAISSVTNVHVLSAPSLVVLDNRTATLQVGDQVPIVTQSAKAVSAGDAPIVTNVELRDTGIILNVTPRVNDSGLVTLDIEQEVSSVKKTVTSGIDSPTIQQRKLKTSVVVSDSEALALGGLIQERESTTKAKVPVLGDVPLLGAAFRQKTDAVSRTELIIFIRPRVIRDLREAQQVTDEFRKQLSIAAPRVRRGEPTPGDELVRILN